MDEMQEYSPCFKMSRPNLFRVLGVQPGIADWTFPPNVQSVDTFGVQNKAAFSELARRL